MFKKHLPQIIALLFLLAFAAFAWQEPTQAPPSGNVPSPINVGATEQTKSGSLNLGGILGLKEQSSIPSFLADFGKFYLKSDNNLYLLDEQNRETNIGGAFLVGDYLISSDDWAELVSSTGYAKAKETKITQDGDLRIKFTLTGPSKSINIGCYVSCPANCPYPNPTSCGTIDCEECWCKICNYEYNGYARIYRNGSPIGTERVVQWGEQTFSEDISGWKKGDLIQIYAKTQNNNFPAILSYFRIYVSNPPAGVEPSTSHPPNCLTVSKGCYYSPSGWCSPIAECPIGYYLTGGGFLAIGTVLSSTPSSSGNGWQCTSQWGLTCLARCCRF